MNPTTPRWYSYWVRHKIIGKRLFVGWLYTVPRYAKVMSNGLRAVPHGSPPLTAQEPYARLAEQNGNWVV